MKDVENLEYLDFTPETQGIFFVPVAQIQSSPDCGGTLKKSLVFFAETA